jgi:hypothetical protein
MLRCAQHDKTAFSARAEYNGQFSWSRRRGTARCASDDIQPHQIGTAPVGQWREVKEKLSL